MDSINNRVKAIIESKGYTSSRFAKELDVIRSSISHVVTGRNKPGVELLQKIIKRFPDVDPGWLLSGNGEMFKDVKDETTIQEQAGNKPLDQPEPDVRSEPATNQAENISKVSVSKDEDPPVYGEGKRVLAEKASIKVKRVTIYYDNNAYQDFYPG